MRTKSLRLWVLGKHQVQLQEYQLALEEMHYEVVKKALIYIGDAIEVVTL